MEDFSHIQDILGQLIFLKTYTQLLLTFPVSASTSQAAITTELQKAASKLTTAFPWLAGKVITEGSGPGNTGLFKPVPYPTHAPRGSLVVVKDCSKLCPSYAELVRAKAPMTMLDAEVLAPRKGIPEGYDESESEPAPVLVIQANFVDGGVLVTFAGQHNVMDMSGQAQVMRLFAKACRGEEFTETEVQEANRDRRGIVPLLGPGEPLRDHSLLRPLPVVEAIGSEEVASSAEVTPAPVSWAYFRFSARGLAELKSLGTERVGEDDAAVPWISTNDVLSAFIWQRVCATRVLCGKSPDEVTTCERAVNVRRYVRPTVPEEYIGHMVAGAFSHLTFSQVAAADLSTLSLLLRKSLTEIDDYTVRSLVTLINGEPDKSTVSYAARINLDNDLLLSSWADLRLYETDFGSSLGKPEFVRRHRFVPLESLMYLMPKTERGDIDAAICLKDEALEAMKVDPEWIAYAEFIG